MTRLARALLQCNVRDDMVLARLLPLALVLPILSCSQPPTTERPQRITELPFIMSASTTSTELTCPVALGEDSRPCLATTTPSQTKLRVSLPEEPELTFAIGIKLQKSHADAPAAEAARDNGPPDKARFVVRAGAVEHLDEVFLREIHPARHDQWIDQVVDLRAYAGQTIWLSFETSSSLGETGANKYAGLFADPIIHDRARRPRGRAVVLVSIDTLRRDHVSVYGYEHRTTPGLERFAAEGIVFDDAVSTSSWTLPAHASLLTSLYPSAHGGTGVDVAIHDGLPAIPGILREQGFFTQSVVTQIYLSKKYGLGAGFDALHWMQEARASEVTDRAIKFLASHHHDDFFLFLHYFDPHFHYEPPPPFDREFDPDYEGNVTGNYWEFRELADTLEPHDLDHILALYDGEIRYVDHELDRFFDEMKRLERFDDALIVVTSDHGEEFLEHGRFGHPSQLYEELIRVPLLLKLPGGETGGRRVSRQTSLIDVAPTMLDILDLPIPSGFQGTNLLAKPEESRSLVWSEVGRPSGTPPYQVSVRRGAGGPKLIFKEGPSTIEHVELYALGDDPWETTDRSAENTDAIGRAQKQLALFLTRMAEGHARDTMPADISPEHLERLRALGYVP